MATDTHTHTLFGFASLAPLGARLSDVAGASQAGGKEGERCRTGAARRGPQAGISSFGNHSEVACQQNAVQKEAAIYPGQRRGEGGGRERQGGRAELGAAFQQEGAQAEPGKGPQPARGVTEANQEGPRRSIPGHRTEPISRDSHGQTGQSPRGPVAVHLSHAY